MGSLGDRIKRYENVYRATATPRMPLMVRVDGRAFHTFTRGLSKPFDPGLMSAMVSAAVEVAKDMQGFKAAYIQSDEATFCITDYDSLETSGWFDYNTSKIVSISAALMTANFNRFFYSDHLAVFDSRAFSIPKEDVVNAFLWRAMDWKRNSIQMYARAFFSHKQMHGKAQSDIHEMLHGIGKNWATDLSDQEKNGTFIMAGENGLNQRFDILPSFGCINDAVGDLFNVPGDECKSSTE